MFQTKINYITAGMGLAFLILLGRFAHMQVIDYDRYEGQALEMRTSITLLEPQRADIVLRDGTVVAHTESVWDVYLDYESFADPRTIARRAHASPRRYDIADVNEFVNERLNPVKDAELKGPTGRRRFFLYWRLRNDPVAQHDFEVCAQRLCLVTGMSRGALDLKLQQIEAEVNTLMHNLGDVTTAESRDVSLAWLRARPALRDPEYWERIRRFPKSLHFAPVLAARLQWLEKEAGYLEELNETAGDDPARLRDLCFRAMQTCRDRADALDLQVNPGGLTVSQAQDILIEEHAHWMRLVNTCEEVVRGSRAALDDRLARLGGNDGLIRATRDRLEHLTKRIIERFRDDWVERWKDYEIDESPLLLVRDAPRDVVEMLKVNADLLPGVICKRRATRRYSHARDLVHVIGSVGLPDPALLEEVVARPGFGEGLEDFIEEWFDGDRDAFVRRFDSLVAHQMFGRFGLESVYDERLAGRYGARAFFKDARGRVRSIEYEKAPAHSEPLTLTLDIELQRDIARTVRKWEPMLADKAQRKNPARWTANKWTMRGAAVVLDVKTGAVLAMVSFPDYDPELLTGRSPEARAYQNKWKVEQRIEGRKGYPNWLQSARMFNRATKGTYAPGSTYKVPTAIALLETGTVTPRDTFAEYEKEVRWNGKVVGKTGHPAYAEVNVVDALELSSNGYFYYYAQELGPDLAGSYEAFRDYSEMFGIGMPMGGDFYYPKRGTLPEPHNVWRPNLAMMAIGQGEMQTTPMEIARLYAGVANRGTLVVPHLSDEARVWPRQMDVLPETWDLVHEGMRRVVFGPRGTANKFPVLKRIKAAGKTGTAENGKGVPDHAWFAGFAPHDDPQVAFVILSANSDLYGADTAPVIAECIERYFEREGVLGERKG